LDLKQTFLKTQWVASTQNYNVAVLLYGCETWSLVLNEDKKKKDVFKNGVLRRIFGPKRGEVKEELKKF
jgi:hypothetical protein